MSIGKITPFPSEIKMVFNNSDMTVAAICPEIRYGKGRGEIWKYHSVLLFLWQIGRRETNEGHIVDGSCGACKCRSGGPYRYPSRAPRRKCRNHFDTVDERALRRRPSSPSPRRLHVRLHADAVDAQRQSSQPPHRFYTD